MDNLENKKVPIDVGPENQTEGSYTTIGYADVILDGKLKTKYISSAPREDTVFEILKDGAGNTKLGLWKGAEKRVLKNPDFVDGTNKQKLAEKPTGIVCELGDLQKDEEGGYVLKKQPQINFIDKQQGEINELSEEKITSNVNNEQKDEPINLGGKEKESVSKKMMVALQKKAEGFTKKPAWLNKLIILSEEIFYLTYLDKKNKKGEKIFTENYFRNEWPNSLYALAGRKIPIEQLIELCENKTITDPSKPFTEEELNGEIGEIKTGEETIKDLCKKQKEEVILTLDGIKNSIGHNMKKGLNLEKTRIGNMIYQDYFTIAGKVNKILNHLAYIATRIKDYDAFTSFNMKEKSFFIQAKDLEALKNLSEEFNEKFPGCAVLVENAMIHGKIVDGMTEEDFLNIIDPKILEGSNKVFKKEKPSAEEDVATPEDTEPAITPEAGNAEYEMQKENIEKRKREAKELHDNSVLTAGDNGFTIKKSKYSYEVAKDLRVFIQKQSTADQTGVIYKFKDDDNIYNYAVSTHDEKRGAGIGYVGYSVKVDKDTSLTDEEIYEILENNLDAAFDQKFPNKDTWETDNKTTVNSIEKNLFDKIKTKYDAELAELNKQFEKEVSQTISPTVEITEEITTEESKNTEKKDSNETSGDENEILTSEEKEMLNSILTQIDLVEKRIKEIEKEIEKEENEEQSQSTENISKKETKSYSVEFIESKISSLIKNIEQIDKVKKFEITGFEKTIKINTTVTSWGFDINVQLEIGNEANGIVVKKYNIDVNWLAKGKAERALTPKLEEISELLKNYIEKEENRKIEKIWIEDGELKAL